MDALEARFSVMDDRLTKLTSATSRLQKVTAETNGKIDNLITHLDGMTKLISAEMVSMKDQYEQRIEVHADRLAVIEKELSKLGDFATDMLQRQARDEGKENITEELHRQLEALSGRVDKHEGSIGEIEKSVAIIKAYVIGGGAVITAIVTFFEIFGEKIFG